MYIDINLHYVTRTLHYLAFPILFLLYSNGSAQQQLNQSPGADLTQPFNLSIDNKFAVGRIFSLSTQQPILNRINQNSSQQDPIKKLGKVFLKLNEIFNKRIDEGQPYACNLDEFHPWVVAANQSARARQIADFDLTCRGWIDGEHAIELEELSREFVYGARQKIIDGRHAFFQAASSIPDIPDKTKPERYWSKDPVEMANWDLKRGSLKCFLDRASVTMVSGKMYLDAEMTNNPVQMVMPDPQRQLIHEYISVDLDSSLQTIHPEIQFSDIPGNDSIHSGRMVKSTTIIERWLTTVALSSVGDMGFDENQALTQASQKSTVEINLADDAITPSNIAILALPLLMSLIPVAFIAELNTWATMWYVVFTDVFSAIPFIVKGIELINTAAPNDDVFTAFRAGNGTTGQIELWVASCQGTSNLRSIGISFVAIGLFTIVFATLLELWASLKMKQKRLRLGMEASGPFGMAMFHTLTDSIFTVNREEEYYDHKYSMEKERRYSREGDLYREDYDDDSRLS